MLGIDGYTVKWGADTSDFDRASRHVRDTAGRDAEEFERKWSKAAKSASDKFIGFRSAGDAVKVFAAGAVGAVGLLTKSLNELGKANEETKASLDNVGRKWSQTQRLVGVMLGGPDGGDFISTVLDSFNGFIEGNIDYREGAGTAAFVNGVLRDRAAQTALFNARMPAFERMSKEKSGLIRADLETRAKTDAIARNDLLEAEREDAARKFSKEEATGDALRIKSAKEILDLELAAADTRYNADIQAINDAAAAQAKADAEEARRESDRQEAERTTTSRRIAEEETRRSRAIEEARDFLEITRRTSQIEILRAQGRTQEANAAQIRLDAEKDIAAIMEKEEADLMDRLNAADAVLASRDAQLSALVKPSRLSDISTFLGPGGIGARGELAAQVLGGPNATFTKTLSVAEEQLNVLQDIARNTAQTPIGVIGP